MQNHGLVATSRVPQSMVLSMLRRFGKIGLKMGVAVPLAPRVRNPLKSSVTAPSFFGQLVSRNQVSQKKSG